MSDPEYESRPRGYPPGFDPERFVDPEHYFAAADLLGFMGIGEEVEIEGDFDHRDINEALQPLSEEVAELGMVVGSIVLERVDGGLSYFPIFIDTAPTASPSLEYLRTAKIIVENNVAFEGMDEQERAAEVRTLASVLAVMPPKASIFRITDDGNRLVHYPQQDAPPEVKS